MVQASKQYIFDQGRIRTKGELILYIKKHNYQPISGPVEINLTVISSKLIWHTFRTKEVRVHLLIRLQILNCNLAKTNGSSNHS